MSMTLRQAYQLLELTENATKEEVRIAYRKKLKKWHPDKNMQNQDEANVMFLKVQEAYETIQSPETAIPDNPIPFTRRSNTQPEYNVWSDVYKAGSYIFSEFANLFGFNFSQPQNPPPQNPKTHSDRPEQPFKKEPQPSTDYFFGNKKFEEFVYGFSKKARDFLLELFKDTRSNVLNELYAEYITYFSMDEIKTRQLQATLEPFILFCAKPCNSRLFSAVKHDSKTLGNLLEIWININTFKKYPELFKTLSSPKCLELLIFAQNHQITAISVENLVRFHKKNSINALDRLISAPFTGKDESLESFADLYSSSFTKTKQKPDEDFTYYWISNFPIILKIHEQLPDYFSAFTQFLHDQFDSTYEELLEGRIARIFSPTYLGAVRDEKMDLSKLLKYDSVFFDKRHIRNFCDNPLVYFWLKKVNFISTLRELELKADNLGSSSRNKSAHKTMNTLVSTLYEAEKKFVLSNDPAKAKTEFIRTCKKALMEAKPILKEHRGFINVINQLLNALVLLGSLGISYAATKRYQFNFIDKPTASITKHEKMEQRLDQLDSTEAPKKRR